MRTVCADLDVELVRFNGEADYVHLLVHYPPTSAISTQVRRLKGDTAYAERPGQAPPLTAALPPATIEIG